MGILHGGTGVIQVTERSDNGRDTAASHVESGPQQEDPSRASVHVDIDENHGLAASIAMFEETFQRFMETGEFEDAETSD